MPPEGDEVAEAKCPLHAIHRPEPAGLVPLNRVPLEWGGEDSERNTIYVCATGAENVKALFRAYEEADGKPSWDIRRSFGDSERKTAELAWEAKTLGNSTV
jgi:hypothetical protein